MLKIEGGGGCGCWGNEPDASKCALGRVETTPCEVAWQVIGHRSLRHDCKQKAENCKLACGGGGRGRGWEEVSLFVEKSAVDLPAFGESGPLWVLLLNAHAGADQGGALIEVGEHLFGFGGAVEEGALVFELEAEGLFARHGDGGDGVGLGIGEGAVVTGGDEFAAGQHAVIDNVGADDGVDEDAGLVFAHLVGIPLFDGGVGSGAGDEKEGENREKPFHGGREPMPFAAQASTGVMGLGGTAELPQAADDQEGEDDGGNDPEHAARGEVVAAAGRGVAGQRLVDLVAPFQ